MFGKLKNLFGGDSGIEITAPVAGKVVALEDVPDPTFAQGILGPGIAIEPAEGRIVAPADGTVDVMFETGQAVTVRGNLATLHDGTIAGSATNLMDCVRSAVKMGVPLGQAIRSASTNPARAIGVEHDYGSLEPGKLANVLLLDEELNIHTILLRGRMLG